MQTLFKSHQLQFKFNAKTSRDELRSRNTWFIKIWDDKTGKVGLGECSPIEGLSFDEIANIENVISESLSRLQNYTNYIDRNNIESVLEAIVPADYPAVRCGIEMAMFDYCTNGRCIYFLNCFTKGRCKIPINGLIWMGDIAFMEQQLRNKLNEGYDCIKIKIGSLDFNAELRLLEGIREKFTADKVTIRVDANGAFEPDEALEKLEKLASYQVHSIEQPIAKGQWQSMAALCRQSPIPIALDEELIGIVDSQTMDALLAQIIPQYLILKPTLLGGFSFTDHWIKKAEIRKIGWWITSALESNIGLNALSQFTAQYSPEIPQGLGTGMLYSNNITSPLNINRGYLFYEPSAHWDLSLFDE